MSALALSSALVGSFAWPIVVLSIALAIIWFVRRYGAEQVQLMQLQKQQRDEIDLSLTSAERQLALEERRFRLETQRHEAELVLLSQKERLELDKARLAHDAAELQRDIQLFEDAYDVKLTAEREAIKARSLAEVELIQAEGVARATRAGELLDGESPTGPNVWELILNAYEAYLQAAKEKEAANVLGIAAWMGDEVPTTFDYDELVASVKAYALYLDSIAGITSWADWVR